MMREDLCFRKSGGKEAAFLFSRRSLLYLFLEWARREWRLGVGIKLGFPLVGATNCHVVKRRFLHFRLVHLMMGTEPWGRMGRLDIVAWWRCEWSK